MNQQHNVMRRCPFCLGEPILLTKGNEFTKKRSAEIECMNCHVKMVVGAIRNSLEWCKSKVIEKWNRRMKEAATCSLKYDHEFLKMSNRKECPEWGVALNGG